jgi:hypothetical protein
VSVIDCCQTQAKPSQVKSNQNLFIHPLGSSEYLKKDKQKQTKEWRLA